MNGMKVINQYVVKYNNALATLCEVEGSKFYIEFNELTMENGWKRQIKEVSQEEALSLINI